MFHRILVALDRSNSSRSVLEEEISLAKSTATLNLVTVVPPMDVGYPDPIYLSMEGMHGIWTTELYQSHVTNWRQQQQEIDQWLRSQIEFAQRQGVSAEYTCPIGIAGDTLCQLATDWQADLIMIGRRGRTGFSELLLGSVSNYVMHHAPCSVLTVQGIEPTVIGQPASTSSVRSTAQTTLKTT